VDVDGDGKRDILSGCYSRTDMQPMAGLFHLLRGDSDGAFKKSEPLAGTDSEPLIIPAEKDKIIDAICTRPYAVDWDGDGNLDLVVGNFAGSFYLFNGEGKGKFAPKPEQIMAGDKPLAIDGHHSDPFVVDWDGDGDLDLLSGSTNGGVQWAENRAGKGKTPDLAAFESLIKSGGNEYGAILREEDLKGPVSATRVWVDDVTGDGKLDLLVGDLVTLVSPAKGLDDEAFKKKHAEWQEAYTKATKVLSSEKADEKERQQAQEEFQKLYSERSKFMKEDRTGFVWLYEQK
jgi:hypothetical protein